MLINFKFAELIKTVTYDEALDWLRTFAGHLGISTTIWNADSVTLAHMSSCASMFEALSEFQAEAISGGFLEHARGSWLRMIARHVYGVEAEGATFATGAVTLTNQGGGLYSIDAGDLIVRNADTGKAYRNVAAFELGASASLTITVVALEAGASSNANAGSITEFVTTLNRVVVTNATSLTARDAESPAELRARCREKLGSLSPFGPWDAYSYAARTARLSTGEPSGVTRTRVTKDGFGNVYVHCASATGEVTGTAGDLATVIGAADDAIGRAAEPLGVTAHVLSAVPVPVTVTYQAWVWNTSGITSGAITERVTAAIQTFFATHSIGGTILTSLANGFLFREALSAAIHNAVPEIYLVLLDLPDEDLELQPNEVAILVHEPSEHVTIHVTARPEGTLQ